MQEMFFGLVGGLGLFLYGMRVMGDSLQRVAGEKLSDLLGKLTKSPVRGVVLGAVVTALIQSSSATTVMVVGFVNAGLMTLHQAIGVIMGANIGTTMTAQLIAFKLDAYALPAVGLGMAVMLMAKRRSTHYIGQLLVGFGLLFLGMNTMKHAVAPLRSSAMFRDVLTTFGRIPILGVLVGVGTTVVVQSSSATIGLLQSLAAEGILKLPVALPVLFGDNIGTCVTALLSSIGTSLSARRAAVSHLVFNVVGTFIFYLMLPAVVPLTQMLASDPVRQIANAHTLFNVGNTLIQLPFVALLAALVIRLVPGQERIIPLRPRYLDRRFLEAPAIALETATKEVVWMSQLAIEVTEGCVQGLLEDDDQAVAEAREKEKVINLLEYETISYLVEVAKNSLTDKQSTQHTALLNIINDVERIGDLGENIGDLAVFKMEKGLTFSETAQNDVRLLADHVVKNVRQAVEALAENKPDLAEMVFRDEKQTDVLEESMRQSHMLRLNKGECIPAAGVVFLDVLSNLERISDHAANIAEHVLGRMEEKHERELVELANRGA